MNMNMNTDIDIDMNSKSLLSEKEECAICLKPLEKHDFFVSKCGHKFHGSCMIAWTKSMQHNSDYCPICRRCLLSDTDTNNLIHFKDATKSLLYKMIQILISHNVPLGSIESLDETVMWMLLPTSCQEELVACLQDCTSNSHRSINRLSLNNIDYSIFNFE